MLELLIPESGILGRYEGYLMEGLISGMPGCLDMEVNGIFNRVTDLWDSRMQRLKECLMKELISGIVAFKAYKPIVFTKFPDCSILYALR